MNCFRAGKDLSPRQSFNSRPVETGIEQLPLWLSAGLGAGLGASESRSPQPSLLGFRTQIRARAKLDWPERTLILDINTQSKKGPPVSRQALISDQLMLIRKSEPRADGSRCGPDRR